MINSNKELKPCPFCGSEPIILSDEISSLGSETYTLHIIKCVNSCVLTNAYRKEEDVISMWNKRPFGSDEVLPALPKIFKKGIQNDVLSRSYKGIDMVRTFKVPMIYIMTPWKHIEKFERYKGYQFVEDNCIYTIGMITWGDQNCETVEVVMNVLIKE